MSPEQASGRALDARSDVFSFSVVLYQMLAGRRPFEGSTDLEILQTIIHGSPQPLGDEIPAAVRSVVEKALRKDPAQRHQSMREMVAAALMVIMIAGALLLFRSKSSTPSGFARYTQLTNVDSAIDPAISPDGRMLAFVRGTSTGVQAVGDPTELCQAPPGWRSSTAHA